ncbi:MAG: hypothetical protein IJW37_02970 [Lachnospiraceae bacterium]|nr:hypothetical protein [Lachnospiraceae bacterium]
MQEEINVPILLLAIAVFVFFLWLLCGREKRKMKKAVARGCVTTAYVVDRDFEGRMINPRSEAQKHDLWRIKYEYKVNGKKYYIKRTYRDRENYKESFKVYYSKHWPRSYVVETAKYDRGVLGCLGAFLLTALTVNVIYFVLTKVLEIGF